MGTEEPKKYCNMGKHHVPVSQFNKNSRARDGLQAYCKECGKAYQKANYEKTKEKRKRYHSTKKRRERRKEVMAQWHEDNPDANRIYRAAHRGRVQGLEGSYTLTEWHALVAEYEHHCVGCLQMKIGELEADHVVPVKDGGANTIDNIQPLCQHCNRKKGTRTHDFRPRWWELKGGRKMPDEEGAGLIVVELEFNRAVGDSYRWRHPDHGSDLSLRLPAHMLVGEGPANRVRVTIEEVADDDDPTADASASAVDEGANMQADQDGEGVPGEDRESED